jgi:hypothetical protein
MAYNDGGEFGPDDAEDAQAAATGTGIGGSEGAPDTGSAIGGDPNFGQAAAANAAAAAAEATGGWDFPDPVGGWATSAPVDSTDTTGEDPRGASSPQNPLDSAMGIIDAAIANTGMPAVGLPGMGLQGFGFTDAQNQAYGQDQGGMTAGVGLSGTTESGGGWGADITGPGYADPNMTAFDASQYGMLSTPQQAHANIPSYAEDMQTMYGADQGGAGVGLDSPASGMPGRGWGEGIAQVNEARDETEFGVDQRGQDVGLNFGPGRGTNPDPDNFVGWGEDIAAPPAPPNTVDPGLQEAVDALQDSTTPPGTVGTLDSIAAENQRDRDKTDASQLQADVAAMKDALTNRAKDDETDPDDYTTEDDETDPVASGMPIDPETGKPVDSVAFTEAYAALQNLAVSPERAKSILDNAIEGKGYGWQAVDFARAMFGKKGPATTQERMDIAVANIQADVDQTAMEMDVSTGEDLRAVQNFKAKYPWANQMSDFEVQAYINSPELLKLKLDNMKITEQMNNNINLTANDVRALWAPTGSGLPGLGQQTRPL